MYFKMGKQPLSLVCSLSLVTGCYRIGACALEACMIVLPTKRVKEVLSAMPLTNAQVKLECVVLGTCPKKTCRTWGRVEHLE